MISLKLSPKEAKEEMQPSPSASKGPRFPYGTCLHLDTETLDKMKLGELNVGDIVRGEFVGVITSYSESQRQDGEDRCNADLQITEIDAKVEADEDDADDAATKRAGKLSAPTDSY